jgi:cytochrome c-type biogenesis protein CcmH
MTFWILVSALTLIVMLGLLALLWRPPKQSKGVSAKAMNVAVFQQRLEELAQDRARGDLDDAQFAQAKTDLERSLLHDLEQSQGMTASDAGSDPRRAAASRSLGGLLILLIVPLVGFAIYWQTGSWHRMGDTSPEPGLAMKNGQPDIPAMIARLEQRLKDEPDNAEGWMMLARSYEMTGRISEVGIAYSKAIELLGALATAEQLVTAAHGIAMSQGDSFLGKPAVLLEQALARDAQHFDGLWLAGQADIQAGNPERALQRWKKLASLNPDLDADSITLLNASAAQAQQALGVPVENLLEAPVRVGLPLRVELSPEFAAQEIDPNTAVFVFARLEPVGPPTLALKLSRADLPANVLLDDRAAIMPGVSLEGVKEMQVEARVAISGEILGKPGDWFGGAMLPLGSELQTLLIDQVTAEK